MSTDKMQFPKKSWSRKKSKTMKAVCSESQLQKFTNELLGIKKIDYMRFSDGFMSWMKLNAPVGIQCEFFKQIGGKMPDNLLLFPLSDGHFLATKLELKTEDILGREVGQLHGKQKSYAKKEGWQIARNPKQVDKVVSNAEALAEMLKKFINNLITEE